MNGVAVTTEVLTLDDGTQYSNVYVEKVTDIHIDEQADGRGLQIQYTNREGATVVSFQNTLDVCRQAKARRHYAVDPAQKRNWQALLEELQANAERGPASLWCCWKNRLAAIQQVLSELRELEREGD